jgi:hypothetical protein
VDSVRPCNRRGTKRIDCPFYDLCLTHAAKHNWGHWSCGTCVNHILAPVYKRARYIHDYYDLLAEIYPEFRRKYEQYLASS